MVFLSCKNALDIPCLRPLPSPLRLVRERHGACGVLPTGHGHALAGSGSPYDAPSAPQAIPCQLCFRGPLLFLVENVLKLLPPLPISYPFCCQSVNCSQDAVNVPLPPLPGFYRVNHPCLYRSTFSPQDLNMSTPSHGDKLPSSNLAATWSAGQAAVEFICDAKHGLLQAVAVEKGKTDTSKLFELAQQQRWKAPSWSQFTHVGPDHSPVFQVTVSNQGNASEKSCSQICVGRLTLGYLCALFEASSIIQNLHFVSDPVLQLSPLIKRRVLSQVTVPRGVLDDVECVGEGKTKSEAQHAAAALAMTQVPYPGINCFSSRSCLKG